LISIDERVLGNYGEIVALNNALLEVLLLLGSILSKKSKQYKCETLKEEEKPKEEELSEAKDDATMKVAAEKCELQTLYYKLFTDDSFAFNKTLLEFK
jgi:hypothetical protein